jgi:hypothetical protein
VSIEIQTPTGLVLIGSGFAKGGSFGAAERLIEVPCNNVVGSLNAFTGAVEYSSYGYNLTPWAVYL